MQFIDINCMIGEWKYDLMFKSAVQLQDEMQRLNISKSLVFHSSAWLYDPKAGNEAVIAETKASGGMIPVISLTSLVEQEFGGAGAVVDFIKSNGIGAVRLFPNDHNYTLNAWNIDKLFSILDGLRIPVLIECRPMEGAIEASFPHIYDLARTYANTPIVLLTVGYRGLRILYDLFDKCNNIFVDTSTFITFRGIEDVVRHFGPKRILFGTRAPFIEAGVSVGRIIYADISPEDRERIACGNALDLLKGLPWLKMEGGSAA